MWLSSTSRPVAGAGPRFRSEGPPRVPLCGSGKTSTLLSLTESVMRSPSEATNNSPSASSSTSAEGTSMRNPRALSSPPLLKLTVASNEARYSVIGSNPSRRSLPNIGNRTLEVRPARGRIGAMTRLPSGTEGFNEGSALRQVRRIRRTPRSRCTEAGPRTDPGARPGKSGGHQPWRGQDPPRSDGLEVSEFSVGDNVIGYTDERASQAECVAVDATHLTSKPDEVPWEVAGALPVAGFSAYAAVRAVGLADGDTVVVAGAAGGVGSITVQLARLAGATVVGLASPANHEWLAGHGVIPVAYGDGVADRIRQAAAKVDAFIDTFGADYVKLALDLGVEPKRVNTIVNFAAVAEYGVKAEGNAVGASAATLA